MTTPTYTPEQALADLAAAVEKYGPETTYAARYKALTGETYEGGACRNKINGEPACIVGVVLSERFGAARVRERGSADTTLNTLFGYDYDRTTWEVLDAAQVSQDAGATWGEALVAAKDAVTA